MLDTISTFLFVVIVLALATLLYVVVRWLDQWRRYVLVRREKRRAERLAVVRRLHVVVCADQDWGPGCQSDALAPVAMAPSDRQPPARRDSNVDPWLANESSLADDLASPLTTDGGGRVARPRDLRAHTPQSLHGTHVRPVTSAPLRSTYGHRMTS